MSQGFRIFLALLLSQGLCVLGGGVPAAALSADDVCSEGDGCALNALQRARVSARGDTDLETQADPTAAQPLRHEANAQALADAETAVTFAGGGYKAMATYVATVAAFQGLTSKKLGCQASLADSFVNVDSFASNSGGGWFFSQLAYSSVFEGIIRAISRQPDQAQTIYNDRWTAPFLAFSKTGKTPFTFLTIMDTITEAERQIHMDLADKDVPVELVSGAVGLALHGLRSTGKIDEITHSMMEAALLTRSSCTCEAMALSRGEIGPADCGCKSLPARATADDIKMAFSESPITAGLARMLGFAPGIFGALVGGLIGLAQNIEMFYGLWQHTGLSWTSIITGMLSQGGSRISPNTHLGDADAVNPWAKGKFWVVCISLITPGGRNKGLEVNAYMTRMNRLSYVTASSTEKDFNLYTPGKIVTKLGGGVGGGRSGVALPLCANSDCFGFYSKWKSSARIPFVTMKKESTPFAPYLNLGIQFSGMQLLNRIVSSSSAALGLLVLMPTYKLGRTFATWVAKSTNPYDQALILQARAEGRGDLNFWRTLRDYSHWNVLPLVDGVLSENTGVMNAVATGHSEITANPAFGPQYLLKLFSDYNALPRKAKAGASEAIQFGGLPFIQIFAMDATSVLSAVDSFPALEVASAHGEAAFVESVSYGSVITNTTDNEWAGITAGESVKLNILKVMSTIGVQATNSFYAYGDFIQQLAVTYSLPSNSDMATEILDKFFLGIGGRDIPTTCIGANETATR